MTHDVYFFIMTFIKAFILFFVTFVSSFDSWFVHAINLVYFVVCIVYHLFTVSGVVRPGKQAIINSY